MRASAEICDWLSMAPSSGAAWRRPTERPGRWLFNADFHGRKLTPLPEPEPCAFPARSARSGIISGVSFPSGAPTRLGAFYLHISRYYGRSDPPHSRFLGHHPRPSISTPGLIDPSRYDDSAASTEKLTPVGRPLRGRQSLPGLLPQAHRHPPQAVRGPPRLFRRASSPSRDRRPIRAHLRHDV
jgi:hypothetical protein